MRDGQRIGCNATEERRRSLVGNCQVSIGKAYECNTTALSNRGKEEKSKAGYDVETKGLDEPARKEVALGNAFLAA